MAVPLHFAIEFLGFAVMAGGAFIVLTHRSLVPGPAFNRAVAAAGLVALAVAQVAHGGSFPGADVEGGRLLVSLNTLGFALLLMSVVGGVQRTVLPAVAGYPLKEPSLLVPSVGALFLSTLAFTVSFRNGMGAMRRLAFAALMFAISHFLTSAAPDTVIGTGTDPYAYGAHAAELVGYLGLSAWLWAGIRSSVRARFVAAFVALLVGVMLVLSTALTGVISNSIEDEERRRVAGQLTFWRDNVEETRTIAGLANQIATPAGNLGDAVAARNEEVLRTLAENLLEFRFPMDFLMFLAPDQRVLASAGTGPYRRLDDGTLAATRLRPSQIVELSGAQVVREVARGFSPASASLEGVTEQAIAGLAAAEINDATGREVGILLIGRFVDARDIERISEANEPAEAILIVRGNVVASRLPKRTLRKGLLTSEARALIARGETRAIPQTFGQTSYFTAFEQLHSEDGLPLATLALSSPARLVESSREGVTRTLFIVAMGVGAIALLLAWLFGRRITRPIQRLTLAARRVREGDLRTEAPVAGEDEVGQLGETFNEMTASLRRMTSDLRSAARAEQQLRARIEAIIESMADGLVAVDGERRILAFNREAEKLTDVSARKALGKPVDQVLQARGPEGEVIRLGISDLAEGAQSDISLRRKSGERVPVAVTSAVLVGDDGTPAGGVAVIRDMTREREVERMKSEFLANISHELRTPLTPIKGYARLLGRKQVPTDKVKQFVKGIVDSTARLERIVELLVDFAALEAGRMAPRTKAVDVAVILRGLADDLSGRAPRHEFVTDIGTRLPKVRGDERLIRRSLEEVLDNAVKFSPKGGTIKLSAQASNGGRSRAVQVTVIDEGIGIPQEDIPKIFSDFQQLDGSETRTYGGLGLGLAFVQRIVEAHRGTVNVASEIDHGTQVTITLPADSKGRKEAKHSKSSA